MLVQLTNFWTRSTSSPRPGRARRAALVAAGLGASAALAPAEAGAQACGKDTDCPGDLICVDAQCVGQGGAPPPATEAPATEPPPASQAPAARPAPEAPAEPESQPVPAPPPPTSKAAAPDGKVPIDLRTTEPGAGVELYSLSAEVGVDEPVAACPESCRVHVPPGRYVVYVTETGSTIGGSREMELYGPTRLTMDPDTRGHRIVGLVFGIGGIAMLGTSAALLANGSAGAGSATLLLGLVATPVGWSVFGTSFKPEFERQPMVLTQQPDNARWQPMPVATPFRGVRLGTTIRF